MSDILPTHDETSQPKGQRKLFWRWLGPMVLACALGVINCFWPTLRSGFVEMQADPIDTRFNHYILEHTFQCLRGGQYVGTFWSPPFYYPVDHVLAYSDNLIGSAPMYWVLRLLVEPNTAFSLWMIGCCVLCFTAFGFLGHRLELNPWLNAAAAMLFGFGLQRSQLINHQQLLPQFFFPLAIWAAGEFVARPTVAKLGALAASVFAQLLCGIYLGWFLAFSLLFLIPVLLIAHRDKRGEWLIFLRRRGWLAGVMLVFFAVVGAGFFWPYLKLAKSAGGYKWKEDVQQFLPPAGEFFPPWHAGDVRNQTEDAAMSVALKLPFDGFIFWGALAAGVVGLVIQARRGDSGSRLAAASVVTGGVMILLCVRWPGGKSAWWFIYQYFPGGTAIRAVSRIDLVIFFYLTLAMVIGMDRLLKRVASARLGGSLIILTACFLCAEQWVRDVPSFDTRPWDNETTELHDLMNSGGDVGYVVYYLPDNPLHFFGMQISAMWAGLKANKPVINGYTGVVPPGYPWGPMGPAEMAAWFSQEKKKPGSLTVIVPIKPGLPREWSLQMPQQSIWATDHFMAGTYKVP
ncbi:MAG TPA: hypothetical protein VHS31_07350 [Tepidisphaeraceae bacterium]|jgi:hypothetical protein|nr:hypothetical protein [Tepidisphaeraceae bacterium]